MMALLGIRQVETALADKVLMVLRDNYSLQGRWVRREDGLEFHVDGKWDENGVWQKLDGTEVLPDLDTLLQEAENYTPPPPPDSSTTP